MNGNMQILKNYDITSKEMQEKGVDKTTIDSIEKETKCREVNKEDTVDFFLNNKFLLKLPEKYNIKESDIKNVFHDRGKKILRITVKEVIGKNQIREALKEYNKCWVKKLFSNENIIFSHVNSELNNEYKTIFTNIKLKKIYEEMWSDYSAKIQTFQLVFKYKKEVIE